MKALGHIQSMRMDLKGLMQMETDMDIGPLTVLVGANGVGKSLIMKLSFAIGQISNAIIMSRVTKNHIDIDPFAQFVLDHTFDDQDFTGELYTRYEHSNITITLDKGKVIKIVHEEVDGLDTPTNIIYMSSSLRLFSSIAMYLKLRKRTGKTNYEDILGEMVKDYTLYDVMYVESLIKRCPIEVTPRLETILSEGFDFKLRQELEKDGEDREGKMIFSVDLEKCEFYLQLQDKDPFYISRFGAGHQSIINMTIAHPHG